MGVGVKCFSSVAYGELVICNFSSTCHDILTQRSAPRLNPMSKLI